MTITNILLLICMLVVAGSGIMISRDVFAFWSIQGGFVMRSIHTAAAQWGLIFISVHLGLHWHMILRVLNNLSFRSENILKTWVMRIVLFVIVTKGVRSLFMLNIAPKLIMSSTFGYWDFENHSFDFFISYVSMMGLYIMITYYLVKLITGKVNESNKRI